MPMTPCIAHLTLGLPVGGTERLVESMMRRPPEGWRAVGICLDSLGALGEALKSEGFPLYLTGRKPGLDLTLPRSIAAICRREKVSVLHCHQYSPWVYGVLARLFLPSLKVILTEHGRFHPDIASSKRRAFNRLLAPLTHRLIAVSPAVTEALVKVDAFPRRRVEVVYNGISVSNTSESRAAIRQRLGLLADGIYVILCARFDTIKWIEGLVQAFAKVHAQEPKARLILVGDGPERPRIEREIAEHQLSGAVHLAGFRHDVADWLTASDIYTLPSHSEGTSVSLIEAMAKGLPAVATRVGGTPEVLAEGETGLLTPRADVDALAQALLTLVRDPDLRMRFGAAAKARYAALFRPESMLEKYAALYRQLVAAA